MDHRTLTSQKERVPFKSRGFFMLFLTLVLMAAIFLPKPDTAYAHYTGDVELTVHHAADCSCGFSETSVNYFIPGSTHKFELAIQNISSGVQIDNILGLTYKWETNEHAVLVKENGTSAWYQFDGISNDPEWDYFTAEASFSYTGYVSDGTTVTQNMSGTASKLFYLFDEFWLVSPSCNPKITLDQETTQPLKLYAKHFSTSIPYGETADITSWVDWTKVSTSGCGVKVTADGVLEALSKNGTGYGDFQINVFQAIRQSATLPKDVIWTNIGSTYCISGTVVRKEQPAATTSFTSSNGNSYRITGTGSKKTVTFYGNQKKPSSITIPDTVTNNGTKYQVTAIADKALKGSTAVKSISIGKYVTSIGKESFFGCTGLTTVKGCAKVQSIGSMAFSGCKKLTSVNGCTKATSIGSKAFYNCTKLKTIGKSSGAITLASVKTIGNSAFSGCKSVKKANLASTALTKIDSKAFYGCTGLSSFTAKSTKLKTIGKNAFCKSQSLNTVTLKTTKLTTATVGAGAFKNIRSSCTFKVPAKKVASYKKLFRAKGAGSKIKVKK